MNINTRTDKITLNTSELLHIKLATKVLDRLPPTADESGVLKEVYASCVLKELHERYASPSIESEEPEPS